MKKEIITDHDLLKLANDWYETIDCVNVGLKSAFAAGYRLAEQQANGLSTGERQSNISDVKASALEKLKIAKKALNDIYNFDRDMEFEYGDPGERAMRALEAIDRIDGF